MAKKVKGRFRADVETSHCPRCGSVLGRFADICPRCETKLPSKEQRRWWETDGMMAFGGYVILVVSMALIYHLTIYLWENTDFLAYRYRPIRYPYGYLFWVGLPTLVMLCFWLFGRRKGNKK